MSAVSGAGGFSSSEPADEAPSIPDDPVDGCWRPPCESVDLPTIHGTKDLDPDQQWSQVYVLLDGFDDECLRAGAYVFDGSRGNVSGAVARGELTDEDGVQTESDWHALDRRLTVTLDFVRPRRP